MKMKSLLFRIHTTFSNYIPYPHLNQNRSPQTTDWSPNLQRTWPHWPRTQNANGYQQQHTKLNLFIVKIQKEKDQEEEIVEAVLNQVGTRVIPQIKKVWTLKRERERDRDREREWEKGKAGKIIVILGVFSLYLKLILF